MIYRALLNADFDRLPAPLRAFHSALGQRSAVGTVAVHHRHRWLAWLVGFPPAGERIPLQLEVTATEEEEVWTRRFGGVERVSTQRVVGDLLMEKAGPVRVGFQIRATGNGIQFESRRARLFGIPVPLRIAAWARGGDSCWEVEVEVAHIGGYRGVVTMTP